MIDGEKACFAASLTNKSKGREKKPKSKGKGEKGEKGKTRRVS